MRMLQAGAGPVEFSSYYGCQIIGRGQKNEELTSYLTSSNSVLGGRLFTPSRLRGSARTGFCSLTHCTPSSIMRFFVSSTLIGGSFPSTVESQRPSSNTSPSYRLRTSFPLPFPYIRSWTTFDVHLARMSSMRAPKYSSRCRDSVKVNLSCLSMAGS